MMKNRMCAQWIFLVAAMVVFAGCAGKPLFSVNNASIPNAIGGDMTQEQVAKQIIAAGAKHGWVMSLEKPGHIVGTQDLGGTRAVVNITHDAKSYSINYKDSQGLKYNSQAGTISGNYNKWVRNLHVSIQRNMGGSGLSNNASIFDAFKGK